MGKYANRIKYVMRNLRKKTKISSFLRYTMNIFEWPDQLEDPGWRIH